jgi:8-oxo-dGTP diphosphatase
MKTPMQIIAVAGLVSNSEGEIVLARHPRRGWEIPGGQVDEGENLIHALKREVREETGIEIRVGALTGIYSKASSPALLILVFLCEYINGALKPSPESPEVAWVRKDKVLGCVTHPAIHGRIQDALEFEGKIRYRVYSTRPYQVHDERYIS